MGRRRRYYRPRHRKSTGMGRIIFFVIIGLLVLSAIIDPKTQSIILTHTAEIIFSLIFLFFIFWLFIGMLPLIIGLFGVSLMITTAPFLGLIVIFFGIMLIFGMAKLR